MKFGSSGRLRPKRASPEAKQPQDAAESQERFHGFLLRGLQRIPGSRRWINGG
jgi:hypothetical protein